MQNAEFLIQKLMRYYQVFTISELAGKMGVSQPSVSGWKRNNYIKAIYNYIIIVYYVYMRNR